MRCTNHLKQLGIAIQNYESAIGCLPPLGTWSLVGRNDAGYPLASVASPHSMLLVHLEEPNLYNAINFQTWMTSISTLAATGTNQTVALQTVGAFLCPSDSMARPSPYGPNSYRVNAGLCGFCPSASGPFDGTFTIPGTRTAEFTDGFSTTIAVSEKLISGLDSYVANRDWIAIDPLSLPDDGFIGWLEWIRVCSSQTSVRQMPDPAGRTWLIGGAFYTSFFTAAPPNTPIPDCGVSHYAGTGVFAARSYHSGGVNVAMADGSVRWVGSGVAPSVWRAMGTRRGGEVVGSEP